MLKLGLFAGLDGLTIATAKALGAYLKYTHAIELMRQKNNEERLTHLPHKSSSVALCLRRHL